MDSENPIDNQQPKPNAGTESNKQSNNPKPEVPSAAAQSQAIPSPHSYKITCDKKRDWIDKATLGLEGFGLFVLIVYTIATIVYACITNNMWKEMQQQTRIQRNTAINAERAWVGLDVPITLDVIGIQSNTRMIIKGHYSLKNFGDGPALKVVQVGNFVDTDRKLAETEADTACNAPIKFSTGTVPVGGDLKPFPPFGRILFPNQPKDEVIDFTGPVQVVEHLRFVGCAAYIDQFKSIHWTRFCMERRPGDMSRIPKLEFCALYNDTEEPKEK